MRSMSRRTWLTAVAAAPLGTWVLASGDAWAQSTVVSDYGAGTLPAGIRSRIVTGVNGIAMHVLEAGFETPARHAAGARLPRTRLQLAQGDAARRGRRLPRDGTRPARLRRH